MNQRLIKVGLAKYEPFEIGLIWFSDIFCQFHFFIWFNVKKVHFYSGSIYIYNLSFDKKYNNQKQYEQGKQVQF